MRSWRTATILDGIFRLHGSRTILHRVISPRRPCRRTRTHRDLWGDAGMRFLISALSALGALVIKLRVCIMSGECLPFPPGRIFACGT